MSTIYQYAKSTDESVIEAIERRAEQRKAFHKAACAFSLKYGTDPKGGYYLGDGPGNRLCILAIVGDKPTQGRWKRGPRGQGWLPYVSDPANAELEALSMSLVDVPGAPASVFTARGEQNYISRPVQFILDGVAYFGVSGAPASERYGVDMAERWVEVKASEFHAAMEGYNESISATRDVSDSGSSS